MLEEELGVGVGRVAEDFARVVDEADIGRRERAAESDHGP
jgi:hypothetical protein